MNAPKHIIDLRSDTLTRPTAAMREAMLHAEVGDDAYGEDPNVNALQEESAALLGKAAALFVPSGTMANQLALRAHVRPGEETLAHPQAHIVRAEEGAGGALAGVQFRLCGDAQGGMPAQEVEDICIEAGLGHFPPIRLICLENTHNFVGGCVLRPEQVSELAQIAQRYALPMHLDGARLLNAAVALDHRPEALSAPFASVSLCFSKGLGAPVGSVIAGSQKLIHECRRYRRMYGGQMRQAGILAAAARYALREHVSRLAEDHARARELADGLAMLRCVDFPYGMPQTNIVYFRWGNPQETAALPAALSRLGVRVSRLGAHLLRAVTHLDVGKAEIGESLHAFAQLAHDTQLAHEGLSTR